MYELKAAEYTESEKKTLRIRILTVVLCIALFCLYFTAAAAVPPQGIFYPYIFAAIIAFEVLLLAAHIIVSFISIKRQFSAIRTKRLKISYIIVEACLSAALACVLIIIPVHGGHFFGDIASGTKTTAAALYKVTSYNDNAVDTKFKLKFFDEDGNYIVLSIPEETAEMLEANPETERKWKSEKNDLFTVPYHLKNIEVEYYPYSKIFIGAEIVDDIG